MSSDRNAVGEQQTCESYSRDDEAFCGDDAVGKFYVEMDVDGEFHQGELWLCEDHRPPEDSDLVEEADA